VTEPDLPSALREALALSGGVRPWRCALQVNPFAHGERAGSPYPAGAAAYDEELTKALVAAGVQVVGLADHHSVRTSLTLRDALTAGGIHVFLGVEVASHEGAHLVTLFPGDTDPDRIQTYLGRIGATDSDASASASESVPEILRLQDADFPEAVTYAAHATYEKGVLRLTGGTRTKVWTDPRLLAAAIPCPNVEDVKDTTHRAILLNKSVEHRREHEVAVICANDVSHPDGAGKLATSCLVGMVEPSIDGLRSAFRDPGSRIRRAPAADSEPASWVEAVSWDNTESFLHGQRLRFSPGLTVLIGGRGTGKSTVIETLRGLAEQPAQSTRMRGQHDTVVATVIKAPTQVQALVRRDGGDVVLDWRVPGAISSSVPGLLAADAMPGLEVWGQGELADLTEEQGTDLSVLLTRFVPEADQHRQERDRLIGELAHARQTLWTLREQLEGVETELGGLAAVQQRVEALDAEGVSADLATQAAFVREERLWNNADEQLAGLDELVGDFSREAALDLGYLTSAAELPSAALLRQAEVALTALSRQLLAAAVTARSALTQGTDELVRLRATWAAERAAAVAAYEEKLRRAGGGEASRDYLSQRRELERLPALRTRRDQLRSQLDTLGEHRASLRERLRQAQDDHGEALTRAATEVNRHQEATLKVTVEQQTPDQGIQAALADVQFDKQRMADSYKRISEAALDVAQLRTALSGGETALQRLGIPPRQAAALWARRDALGDRLDEVIDEVQVLVELNIGTSEGPVWRPLKRLSRGQRANALLLLLLVPTTGAGPLVLDQPEDDLDNRLIVSTIVPALRRAKRHRQVVVCAHDPNIPVLGDAELIIELTTQEHEETVQGQRGRSGALDTAEARHAVEDILEGGRDAFERRRQRYGIG